MSQASESELQKLIAEATGPDGCVGAVLLFDPRVHAPSSPEEVRAWAARVQLSKKARLDPATFLSLVSEARGGGSVSGTSAERATAPPR